MAITSTSPGRKKLNLDFGTFFPKQTEFLNLINASPATTIGYGGSRGGSKSYTARLIVLMRRFQFPGTAACILRRTYDLVRENHVDPLKAQFPELSQYYHIGDKELRLPGNTTIAFRYAENQGDVDAMIGKQYMDFFIDQAEQFSERELNVMKSCCRWPGVAESQCKFMLTFNPGGIGHAHLKRIFIDKKYREGERAEDYAFLQAFGWDNVMWARTALAADGLTDVDFYSWDSDTRFAYFIDRTQYGRELNALPQAMRIGWLLGRMDQFAGQYYDIFSPDRHVMRVHPDPWQTRWLGIDWGFAHESVCLWAAQIGERMTGLYREFAGTGRSPKSLAQEIVDRTPAEERKLVKHIFLSHDAFARRTEQDTIADQMAEVFRLGGMPYPEMATKDVVGRATLLYDMLGPMDPSTREFRAPEIAIDPACKRLIETLPMVCRDPDRPEFPLKFEGDDAYDAAAHTLTYRMRQSEVPREVQLMEQANKIADPVGRWFFLQKHRQNKPRAVVQQRVVMPWEQGGPGR
jgi:hypothetical protein